MKSRGVRTETDKRKNRPIVLGCHDASLFKSVPKQSVYFIAFRSDADHLEIVSGGTSETLRASVAYPGEGMSECISPAGEKAITAAGPFV
jgi:hypothetical protein